MNFLVPESHDRLSHVRVKICGITSPADASLAAEAGADAIGINFYPLSRRHVSMNTARSILEAVPLFVDPVAVFVNESRERMLETLDELGPVHTVQWHGDEWTALDHFPFRTIVAFGIRDEADRDRIRGYLDRWTDWRPDAILVDARVDGEYGGTGQTLPWKVLDRPLFDSVPLLLAGGLTAENVAEAIRIVRPYGVDVASGVENSPGRKDAEKMIRFIANAREAAAR